jgi:hypothetical protein
MNPSIDILEETPLCGAWLFRARLGEQHERTLRLSWQDYEDWSAGALPPQRVAQAVFVTLLQHYKIEDLPDQFDAARYRRSLTAFDDAISSTLASLPEA